MEDELIIIWGGIELNWNGGGRVDKQRIYEDFEMIIIDNAGYQFIDSCLIGEH